MSHGPEQTSIPEVPPLGPLQRVARSVAMTPRRLTQAYRQLPSFLILGAQRAGTSSLRDHLAGHPSAYMASPKEVHFFDLHFGRGLPWYRAHFPLRRRGGPTAIGEATPYYAFHPCAPARAHAAVPDAKLIFLAREPVERALSHYHLETRFGFEDAPLLDALQLEEERLAGAEEQLRSGAVPYSHAHHHHSYVARGLYARQLRAWLELYPRDRLLVLSSEQLFSAPEVVMPRILRFLELPEAPLAAFPRHNALARREVDPAARAFLEERLRPHDAELYELAGEDLGW